MPLTDNTLFKRIVPNVEETIERTKANTLADGTLDKTRTYKSTKLT